MADKYILPGSVLIRTTVTQTLQVCGTLLKHIPSFRVFDDDGFRDCCLTCCSTISCSSSAGLRSGLTNRTFIFQNPVNQTRVNILECMCKRKFFWLSFHNFTSPKQFETVLPCLLCIALWDDSITLNKLQLVYGIKVRLGFIS